MQCRNHLCKTPLADDRDVCDLNRAVNESAKVFVWRIILQIDFECQTRLGDDIHFLDASQTANDSAKIVVRMMIPKAD